MTLRHPMARAERRERAGVSIIGHSYAQERRPLSCLLSFCFVFLLKLVFRERERERERESERERVGSKLRFRDLSRAKNVRSLLQCV